MAVLSGPLLSREDAKYARTSAVTPSQISWQFDCPCPPSPYFALLGSWPCSRTRAKTAVLRRLTDKCLVLPYLNKVFISLHTTVDSAAALLSVQQDEKQWRLRTKVKIKKTWNRDWWAVSWVSPAMQKLQIEGQSQTRTGWTGNR